MIIKSTNTNSISSVPRIVGKSTRSSEIPPQKALAIQNNIKQSGLSPLGTVVRSLGGIGASN